MGMGDSGASGRVTSRPSGRADAWLESHIELLAMLALAVGFMVRVVIARSRYLVADEALDYLLVNQRSALEAYRTSLTNAHPPLFYFVLYYWRFLGTSELMLRFPSVVAGTVMPWFAFLWLKRALGAATAFLALLLLTFAPPLVAFSTEVRPYAFLVLFLAAALWSLGRGFERNSASDMLLFGAFLCLAIYTQYSAIWVAIAAGIYALARIFSGELRKTAIFGWIASQMCALAVLGLLWVKHISRLRNGVMESVAVNGWLRAEYFQTGEHVLHFLSRTTADAFLYLLSRQLATSYVIPASGVIIALVFLFAIVLLVANCAGGMKAAPGSTRMFGVLMLLPVVVGCAGAMLRLYPYGGSRHVAYLALFVMAGIALDIAWLSRKAFWVGIAATLAAVIACNAGADPTEYMPTADQATEKMEQAVKYIRESVPAGGVIVVDYNSSLVMRYYLCSGAESSIQNYEDKISQFTCGNYEMARTRGYDWTFTSENTDEILAEMEKEFGWTTRQPIWLVQADETPLDAAFLARFGAATSKKFGGHIAVTQLRAP
jgi:uncharacterized membrane protein